MKKALLGLLACGQVDAMPIVKDAPIEGCEDNVYMCYEGDRAVCVDERIDYTAYTVKIATGELPRTVVNGKLICERGLSFEGHYLREQKTNEIEA